MRIAEVKQHGRTHLVGVERQIRVQGAIAPEEIDVPRSKLVDVFLLAF